MSHTPHELAEDFPEHAAKIAALKASDAHFAKLCDAYHEVNRAVHRAESELQPTTEADEEAMRRERIRLKDEIYAILVR